MKISGKKLLTTLVVKKKKLSELFLTCMLTLEVPGTGLFEDNDCGLLPRCGMIVISSLILKGCTCDAASGRLPYKEPQKLK